MGGGVGAGPGVGGGLGGYGGGVGPGGVGPGGKLISMKINKILIIRLNFDGK